MSPRSTTRSRSAARARSVGLDGSRVELSYERFESQVLGDDAATARFEALLEGRIVSLGAVRKLAFVHRVVEAGGPDRRAPKRNAPANEFGRGVWHDTITPIASG